MRTSDYRQIATLWSNPEFTSQGQRVFNTVQKIRCRWEDRAERFIDQSGQEVVSRAVVWVRLDVALDSYIALGDFEQYNDPTKIPNAYPVRSKFSIPDLRMSFIERRLFL